LGSAERKGQAAAFSKAVKESAPASQDLEKMGFTKINI
jgi:hypothetical protein